MNTLDDAAACLCCGADLELVNDKPNCPEGCNSNSVCPACGWCGKHCECSEEMRAEYRAEIAAEQRESIARAEIGWPRD